MALLFGRTCAIIVDSLQVTGLRVSFRVSKNLGKEPNTLEARVYNLAESTRSRMQRKGARVVLSAGYEGSAAVLFSGDARTIDHTREGVDWCTVIRCGDGERAYQFARFRESFRPGTGIADVALAAGRALGVNLGNLSAQLAQGNFKGGLTQFTHGYTAHGNASAELDKVLRVAGLSWSIQDGALQVLRGAAPADGLAVLLTPETGLVGSPDHCAPSEKGKPPLLKVQSLLQPRIRCGGRIDVRAAGVKGQFRVEKLQHEGDTHGGPWYTSVEAVPV